MTALSEVVRLRASERRRHLRQIDYLHDEIADLGSDEAMSETQLEALYAGRPGTVSGSGSCKRAISSRRCPYKHY